MKFDIVPPVEKLTLECLDKIIQKIREDGAEPKGFVMHFQQYQALFNIMALQSRFMDVHPISSIHLCYYRGIPIYPKPWGDGYKCEACGEGATTAYLESNGKLIMACKYHENRARMFAKLEEIE